MNWPLRLLPAVAWDVTEAAAWYNVEGGDSLGERFLASFRRSLTDLQGFGPIHSVAWRGFRKYLLKSWPYAVYYREDKEGLLVVVLVIHTARGTGTRNRLLRQRAKEF